MNTRREGNRQQLKETKFTLSRRREEQNSIQLRNEPTREERNESVAKIRCLPPTSFNVSSCLFFSQEQEKKAEITILALL